MRPLLLLLVGLVLAQPPAWIQRVVPPPIVAWREADVLGSAVPEGIAVNRLPGVLTVNVVDSRFDPPRIVRERDLRGTHVRWLRAGRRDRLARSEIAIDVVGRAGETAYLLRVGRDPTLQLVRAVHGKRLTPSALRR